jgi:hypothetical protein
METRYVGLELTLLTYSGYELKFHMGAPHLLVSRIFNVYILMQTGFLFSSVLLFVICTYTWIVSILIFNKNRTPGKGYHQAVND